ncbi:MAG: LpxI family protein [Alphaproteobacteria bacterium]
MTAGDSGQGLPKVAIIAGGGTLPLQLADACRRTGRPYLVLAVDGFADEGVSAHPHERVGLASFGRAFKLMRAADCEAMVFAGIISRPDFSKIKPDLVALKRIPRIVRAARGGDNQLLGTIVSIFEEDGFTVLGAHEVAPDLLAPEGVFAAREPTEEDHADIARGIEVVRAMGNFDIGQGAAVCDGLVLAVEAAEGTDRMLERCATLPRQMRGTEKKRKGVFVKAPKPGQERRVDLPTIGPRTVERVAAAGMAGIAVEAGGTLILDREETVALADEAGIFLYGFAAGEGADERA